ncbi:MAG: glyoxalase [Micromonosporaceae bacterium]|nr:glyoxalase [Micromonosporaceae bacterium]
MFVNLPVKDLDRAIEFWTKIGYSFNKQFTDENATCMVISDDIYAMLLVEPFFKTFHDAQITDPTKQKEVILALAVESRERVDELADEALAAGGQTVKDPDDQGFMYQRNFSDLDGHMWEIFWMDPSAVEPQE